MNQRGKTIEATFTSTHDVTLQRKCTCGRPEVIGGECAACRQKRLESEQRGTLQRRAVTALEPGVAPPIVNEVLRTPGRPLDPATRAFMERHFDYDFSGVKVHTGEREATSADAVEALAYTVGNHIVFNQGQFRPQTNSGRRLLAHELAHVVQQSQTSQTSTFMSGKLALDWAQDSAYEREAQLAADRVGQPLDLRVQQASSSPSVQRAAPAAAAAGAGIGALLSRCAIGALVGVAIDLGLQALLYSWRRWTWRFWNLTVDYCSVFLSAVLGCLGGIATPVVERWVGARLGPRLGGVAGTLLGRILIWLATRAGIAVPKGLTKLLLKLGCVSPEQAEVIEPGISSAGEEQAASEFAPGTGATLQS